MIRYDEALGKWVFDHDGKTYTLPSRWEGTLAIEKQVTGDGRMLEAESLRWNLEDSMPMRAVMSDVGMHDNAEVIGRIETVERGDDLRINGTGSFDLGSEVGREAARLCAMEYKRGVSVDLDEMTFEIRIAREILEDEIDNMEAMEALYDEDVSYTEVAKKQLDEMEEDEDGRLTIYGPIEPAQEIMVTLDARIRAATLVDVPAFSGASINAVGVEEIGDSNVNGGEPTAEEEIEEGAEKRSVTAAAVEVDEDGSPDRTIPEDVQGEATLGQELLKANESFDVDERAVEVANVIVDGGEAEESLIREMVGFFEENQEVRDEEGFNEGEDGYPTVGRVEWQLWGGNTGWDWASEVISLSEGLEERAEIEEEIDDGDTDLGETPVEVTVAAAGIPPHDTETSTDEWDGPENEARLADDGNEGYYSDAYAWKNDDETGDQKTHYKFIHHHVEEGGTVSAANLTACENGIGVLNGGRGGADVPEGDVERIYNHLAQHMIDADVEPPALAPVESEDDGEMGRRGKKGKKPKKSGETEEFKKGKKGRKGRKAGETETLADEGCTDCDSPPSFSLVAAAPAMVTEAAVFDNPHLPGPTPLTITKQGRVFGHLALWGTCHIGMSGTCVTPPKSTADYAYFHTGAITMDDTQIPVGQITLGGGHADMSANANAAVAHYDQTGLAVADIVVGEDDYGIWFSGQLRQGVTEEQRDELRAGTLSGDWRAIGGNLELVAALAVNVPGFPVPRTKAHMVAAGQQTALVAAGIPEPVTEEERSNMKVMSLVASAMDRRERVAAARLRVEEGVAKTRKMRYDSALKRLGRK